MRISKKVQYGILLMLYLTRSGRTTIANISEGLNISKPFLVQIANDLRKASLIKSTKGPNGGYEIVGYPVVKQIFTALEPLQIISEREMKYYTFGEMEHRALAFYVDGLTMMVEPMLNIKIKDIEKEFTIMELNHFEKVFSRENN